MIASLRVGSLGNVCTTTRQAWCDSGFEADAVVLVQPEHCFAQFSAP